MSACARAPSKSESREGIYIYSNRPHDFRRVAVVRYIASRRVACTVSVIAGRIRLAEHVHQALKRTFRIESDDNRDQLTAPPVCACASFCH